MRRAILIETASFLAGAGAPLYVMTHSVGAETAKGVVVIVPPFAEEKKAAQRALVEAARAFAADGFEVVRFDLRGTGDSAGAFGQCDVEGWLHDLRAVLAQTRSLAGERPLHLLGLRFGASLAWLAATPEAKVASLILWEPIVAGATYMRQNRQRSQIRKELTDNQSEAAKVERVATADPYPAFDFDGFEINAKLHREMTELDLLTAPLPACQRVQILQISGSSRLKKPLEELSARAEAAGAQVTLENVAVEAFWSAIGLVDTAPVRDLTRAWLKADALATANGHHVPISADLQTPVTFAPALNAALPAIQAEPFSFMSGDQRAHGVLYRPTAPVERCVFLLHGWSGYRIGPGHLLTEAARALAAAGYAAYSFDFRGRGESEWEVGEASLNSMIRDACRAVPFLLEHTGASKATLLGLCSGGEVALGASLSDARIDSLALWSAPVFSGAFTLARQARRSQDSAKKYARKLFYPETWAKLFTGRLNYRMIGKALSGGRSNEDAGVENKAPDTSSQMQEFEEFKGRLLFIYGGNDPETPPSRDFYREFVERTAMPHEFHEVAGANHNYYSMAWKRQVIETTVEWLGSSETAQVMEMAAGTVAR